jgi:hypothetical protein
MHSKEVRLTLPLQLELLTIATGCVEQSAMMFGQKPPEAMALTLAVEEVYSFLASREITDENLTLICRDGLYYTEVSCHFHSRTLPVSAFNITAAVASDDEKSLEEMGLLLAARTTDCLHLSVSDGGMAVHFTKDKKYPLPTTDVLPEIRPGSQFEAAEATPELIKQFALRVGRCYGKEAPEFFRFPGKVVDMFGSGDYNGVFLRDGTGNVGAGMLWTAEHKMVECFGPYVFAPDARLASQVVEATLNRLARTKALCIVVEDPTAEMPPEYFERLERGRPELYRQLEEDSGTGAYVHTDLKDFLHERYQKLCLPREIHQVEKLGELSLPWSAFTCQMDRLKRTAVLSALSVGEDAGTVLAEHVRVLGSEGYERILFRLDTGISEQAMLAPALLGNGFRPEMLLPWGGRGDIIVLGHQEGEEC